MQTYEKRSFNDQMRSFYSIYPITFQPNHNLVYQNPPVRNFFINFMSFTLKFTISALKILYLLISPLSSNTTFSHKKNIIDYHNSISTNIMSNFNISFHNNIIKPMSNIFYRNNYGKYIRHGKQLKL